MSIKTKTIWACDLCQSNTTMDNTDTPIGWCVLNLESTYSDRTFFDKHICKRCVQMILDKNKKST